MGFRSDTSKFTDRNQERGIFQRRVLVAFGLVVALTLGLVGRLAYLQIIQHQKYAELAAQNRIQSQAVAPPRGLIYDRQGRLLALNSPVNDLVLVPEQIDDLAATLDVLRSLIDLSDEQVQRFRTRLERSRRPFESVTLKSKLTDDEVSLISVDNHRLPGVSIEARLARRYPYGNLLTHALGYVGRINEKELGRVDAAQYRATEYHGKLGVERFYETQLHGQVGVREVEANARGRVMRVLSQVDPTPGADLTLYLDVALQQAAVDALAGRKGSVVALDTRTGGVLAMVSIPSYDPNPFVTGISSKAYRALRENPQLPLYNRAIRGQYPPGSTIKPLLAMAGLDAGRVDWQRRVFDPGFYQLDGAGRRYRDWKRGGHGWVRLEDGIVESCDIVFYDLAVRTGIDDLSSFMQQFGFGREQGMDVWGDASGILPSRDWKRANRGIAWYPGETVITGIGQGYWLTTPLQLASSTAALANRGLWREPKMVQSLSHGAVEPLRPETVELPSMASKNWGRVVTAMEKVMHGSRGTARAAGANAKYRIAGKTGTAQVRGLGQDEEYDAESIKEKYRDHALFVGFAPATDPRIAVAVIVENGGSGGSTAGPVARQVMDAYLLNQNGELRVFDD